MGESLGMMNDSTMVVAYLKKQGIMASLDMCRLVLEVRKWLELLVVTIIVRYIPGKKNVLAYQLNHPDQVLPTDCSRLP